MVVCDTEVYHVVATDPSGNSATAAFDVDNLGTPKAFTYDANGNLTSDGTRTFEWDAANRIVRIAGGLSTTKLSHDGYSRILRTTSRVRTHP